MSTIVDNILEMDSTITAVLIITLLTIQAIFLFFPKDVIMLLGGFLLGFTSGGLINVIGLIGASWMGYEFGNLDKVSNAVRSKKYINKFARWYKEKGIVALIAVRALPLIPFNMVSVSSGVSNVKKYQYLIISFIFSIPYAFFWAYVGSHSQDIIATILPNS